MPVVPIAASFARTMQDDEVDHADPQSAKAAVDECRIPSRVDDDVEVVLRDRDRLEQDRRQLVATGRRVLADADRRLQHRVEHVELPRPDHPARMARLGVVASMQPAFDALWGGDGGLYATRFGVEAARASNPFVDFAAAGCARALPSQSSR